MFQTTNQIHSCFQVVKLVAIAMRKSLSFDWLRSQYWLQAAVIMALGP